MADLIGRDVGRYHIVEGLGTGGMAVVYKAFDTRLEREVAIKFIRREAITPEQYEHMLKRFEREAKALARLTHPNIVAVHDFGEYEGSPYLVMEYVPGGTLKTRMGSAMRYDQAAQLLAPVARALEYAHQRKIIHRDVKPVNILLTETGQPMLSDFGIAKILESEQTAVLTSTGVGVGTPEYIAPEQATGRGADHRADIYSLGIILFEMVTGVKPYQADTPLAVIIKHINDPLPRPRQWAQDLPEEVERVIFKCLAKNPDDRYQETRQLAQTLERLAQRQLQAPEEERAAAYGDETRVIMESETRVEPSAWQTPPPTRVTIDSAVPPPTRVAAPPAETRVIPESQPTGAAAAPAPIAAEAEARIETTPLPAAPVPTTPLPGVPPAEALPQTALPAETRVIPERQPAGGAAAPAPIAAEAEARIETTPLPAAPVPTTPLSGVPPAEATSQTTPPAALPQTETRIAAVPPVMAPPTTAGAPASRRSRLLPLALGGLALFGLAAAAAVFFLVIRPLLGGTTPSEPSDAASAVKTQTASPVSAVIEQESSQPEATQEITPQAAAGPLGYEPIPLPANPRTITIGFINEPDAVLPYGSNGWEGNWLAAMTLSSLIDINGQNQPYAELVSEIPSVENGGISEDQKTITWHLRPNLYWSDGMPITVEDLVFTVRVSQEAEYSFEYQNIDRLTPIDDLTLEMHFSEVTPNWYQLFPVILPAHVLKDAGNLSDHPFMRQPSVGSGAFVMTDWQAGSSITLLPNPNFYLGRPKLDGVIIRFFPDEQAALDAMSAGEIDLFAHSVLHGREPILSLEQAQARGLDGQAVPQIYKERYAFNLATAAGVPGFPDSAADQDTFCPFLDVRVRRAMLLAIDRNFIANEFWRGFTEVPRSELDNTLWEFADLPLTPFDPDLARALLSEAGYEDRNGDGIREGDCNGRMTELSFELITTTTQVRTEVAGLVVEYLRQVGINAIHLPIPSQELFGDMTYAGGGRISTGNYVLAGFSINFVDLYPATDYFCDLNSASNPDGASAFYWCDPTMMSLMEAANSVADLEMRRPLVHEALAYQNESVFQLLLYNRFIMYYYRPGVRLGGFNSYVGPYWNSEVWNIEP